MVVHEGREQEAESLRMAFKSAGGHGTKVRDGVIGMTHHQMESRITQLSSLGGQQVTLDELNKGLQHVQRMEARLLSPQEDGDGPTRPARKSAEHDGDVKFLVGVTSYLDVFPRAAGQGTKNRSPFSLRELKTPAGIPAGVFNSKSLARAISSAR